MKATAVKKIFNQLSEDCMVMNSRAREDGVKTPQYDVLTISTSNREYQYAIGESSNWNVEDDILWLEGDEGTRWIDCDKIESITI